MLCVTFSEVTSAATRESDTGLRVQYLAIVVSTVVTALLVVFDSVIDGRVFIFSGIAVTVWAVHLAGWTATVIGPRGFALRPGARAAVSLVVAALLMPVAVLGIVLVFESYKGIGHMQPGEPWGHSSVFLACEICAVTLLVCICLRDLSRMSQRVSRSGFAAKTCLLVVVLTALGILAEVSFVITRNFGTNSWEVYETTASRMPGARFTWRGRFGLKREFNVEVLNNRYGFHDIDRPPGRSLDGKRILVLGDSFVEGLQVGVDEIVGRRLESILEGSGRSVEVFSFGVSGTGPVQQEKILEEVGWKLHPDLVIACVLTANDVRNSSTELERRAQAEYGFRLDRTGVYRLSRFYGLRWPGYLLWRADRLLADWRHRGRPPLDSLVYLRRPAGTTWEDAWSSMFAALDEMAEQTEVKGVRFAVVVVADSSTMRAYVGDEKSTGVWRFSTSEADAAWDLLGPDSQVVDWCSERGIPVLALGDEFARLSPEERASLYFSDDGHWTRTGHDQAARAIAQFVVGHHLL